MNQHGSSGEVVLEVPEHPVSSWGPCEWNLGGCECRQGGSHGVVTPDKVGKSQETLQLHSGYRLGPIHHCSICTFLAAIHKKLVIQEALEDLSDMEHVFLG
jgi:hypothetical protein